MMYAEKSSQGAGTQNTCDKFVAIFRLFINYKKAGFCLFVCLLEPAAQRIKVCQNAAANTDHQEREISNFPRFFLSFRPHAVLL